MEVDAINHPFRVTFPSAPGLTVATGSTQTVTWNAVPNTPQPDGSTWATFCAGRTRSYHRCSENLAHPRAAVPTIGEPRFAVIVYTHPDPADVWWHL